MHIPCNGISIGLDSSDGDIPFLSHAHSDHTSGVKRQRRLISTPETRDLAGIDATLVSMPGTKLIDAGHVLGARQLAVEGDGERIVYSGDICLKQNIFGFKAEIPRCDRLIMEATYGDPSYVFPSLEEIYGQISSWVKENESSNLIIGCYHLGKAQEMIKILNECSVVPIVTERTEEFCSVYEKYGIRLERIMVGTEEAEKAMSRAFVAVVPMGKARRYFASRLAEAFGRPTLCAAATGWALHYRFNTDAAFPLSDHADFNDLVQYAEQSEAKDIEFFCGNGKKILSAVRRATILNS